jgi:hypothetical protein
MPFALKIGMYYLLAYVLTGVFFLLQGATNIRGEFIQFPQIGPALAAVIFIALEGNSVKRFFKKGFRFSLDSFTIILTLITIALIAAVSIITTNLWQWKISKAQI